MIIVPIFRIKRKDKDNVQIIFRQGLHLSGFISTKTLIERIFTLITSKFIIYKF